jgi:hypothetical protein
MARPPKASKTTTLIAAVLLGVAESTGLAPKSLTRPTLAVHWLAPERKDDLGFHIVFSETPPGLDEAETAHARSRLVDRLRWSRAWARIRARFRH